MIQELVEFGKRVTKGKNQALKEEQFSITIVIDEEGKYQQFIVGDREPIESEVITAKKGKARFLLDKSEEVLGVSIDISKLESFKKSLVPFKNVDAFTPVFKFYEKENLNGLRKAVVEYFKLDNEYRGRSMSFSVNSSVLLAEKEVQDSIYRHERLNKKKKGEDITLGDTSFDICININETGEFLGFVVDKNNNVRTEKTSTKKKEVFFFIGSDVDVFGITEKGVDKKHQLFMDKLMQYKDDLKIIEPVIKFYTEDNEDGVRSAIADSIFLFSKDSISENLTFMMKEGQLLLKYEEVRNAIVKHFRESEQKLSNGKVCSICGRSDSPVLDEPHGMAKNMPKPKEDTISNKALVSFNEGAFESYGLKGNLNSSICRNCARNYIDGLNFLLSDGHKVPENKEKKQKAHFEYNHRVDLSDTTAALFWTKQDTEEFSPLAVTNPPDASWVKRLFESVWNGKKGFGSTVDSNMFYTCTLSSAAARIAVRDWTAISLTEYKTNLAEWFRDIEIENNDRELVYSPLRMLIAATQRDKKPGDKPKSDLNSKTKMGSLLWNAVIKGSRYKLPLEVLQSVLNRIWKGDFFSVERAALIKLIINRNTDKNMRSTLEEANTSVAYLCGRLFAVIELMQWKAMGNVNSGVKERYFAAAALQPAYILGQLLTKNVTIYQRKIGGYLANELNEIAGKISENGCFPQRFSAIEQGEFALGYYFQRNHKKETTENTNS